LGIVRQDGQAVFPLEGDPLAPAHRGLHPGSLVHLIETHHTPAFWQRIERSMPDYALRKEWLAANGLAFVV
jgi:hypothetical protein